MRLSISAILNLANSKKTDEERIAVLQSYRCYPLEHILRLTFDPTIRWMLPQGKMDYTPSPYVDTEAGLYVEAKRLYIFVEQLLNVEGMPEPVWVPGNSQISQDKREALWFALLEALDKNDALLMLSVKDKKLPQKNITAELVLQAFPGLF